MRRAILLIAFLTIAFSTISVVEAKQYTRRVNGREVVVHTNPIPVVLHRMVPPQHGRHVTERELQKGQVPAPARYGSRIAP